MPQEMKIDFDAAKGYPDTVVDQMVAVVELAEVEMSVEDMQDELHELFIGVPIALRAYVYRAFTEALADYGWSEREINIIARGDA